MFFIAEDSTETKVIVVVQNNPSRLVFDIPADITSGDFRLVVRNELNGALGTKLTAS